MSFTWLKTIGLMLLLLVLSGCNQSIDDQIANGLQLTETVFAEEPEEHTEKIGDIKLYLPSNFKVEDSSDAYNIVISKGKESYILFINDEEAQDSKLYYNLLKENEADKIIEELTYDKNGRFGFTAVLKTEDKNEMELIVSSGGVKMTTISQTKHIETNLREMTKIVHSVKMK
ncbi:MULTISPECIES: hypothetical protein [Lysinibacillus]|uniref:DUF4367 domain-containing protein n=2 Tax=Bacillaceae TaxID=186817 RepID=A0A2I0V241_9BACI|nr:MULTISPECIES: hypothetical protein [Lysinibacillus]KUF29452.1 hypothetical protein AK833_19425 [Lysinibacillus sp. F5]MEE3805387.1 hypothetical protein [Lysinibacillus fusiformis]PKU52378.1 hypothetical protein CRI88_08420 [Lysinibacillus fusiformis]WCH46813.1 hypothetical protein NV349_17215 [Lysinibacillus sp. OF-1]SCZ01858.1 hypothetical protein SAMN02787078_03636 [Lysinibacillus sp. SG9]